MAQLTVGHQLQPLAPHRLPKSSPQLRQSYPRPSFLLGSHMNATILTLILNLFCFSSLVCYALLMNHAAEESAIVLGQEPNGDSIRQKFRQTVITLFDTDIVVSGSDQNDNELSNWHEVPSGTHTYPFALKVPNVNFPPCIPVRCPTQHGYIGTSHLRLCALST
jgi:hypothetical protein